MVHPTSPRSRALRVAPIIVAVVGSAVWLTTGHTVQAVVVGVLALVLVGLELAGIDPARPVRALSRAVSAVIVAVLVVPTTLLAWSWSRIRRRHPLAGPDDRVGPHWQVRGADLSAHRMFADTGRGPTGRSLVGRVSSALGAGLLIIGLNYGLGWSWDAITTTRKAPAAARSAAAARTSVPPDPRVNGPAMAAYPWRRQYLDDLQRISYEYWPFTESRPLAFSSPYINIDSHWVRRSYEPSATSPRPTVWVFGGSTAFGEGQRDLYTIPSWISRIAEREGLPLTVVNYGQRGWTHFQEMILFEQLVSTRPAPDLAIFYDGANEITSQAIMSEAVPSHTFALDFSRRLSGIHIDTRVGTAPSLGSDLASAYTAYRQHSLVHKLAGWLGIATPPAGAETGPAAPDPLPGFDVAGEATGPDGKVTHFVETATAASNALDVFRRGQSITASIATRHHVQPVFFWQPIRPDSFYSWVSSRIRRPVVDISHALDSHADVYLDGVHTNEDGARIVAEAMWPTLRPAIQAWYGTHRRSSGGGSPSTDPSTTTTTPPTEDPETTPGGDPRLAFISLADGICATADVSLDHLKTLQTSDPAALATATRTTLVPAFRQQIYAIQALGLPAADAPTLGPLLDAALRQLARYDADPTSALTGGGAEWKAAKAALTTYFHQYSFADCFWP